MLYERKYSFDLYSVVRSRVQIHSVAQSRFTPIPEADEDGSVHSDDSGHSDDSDCSQEMTVSYRIADQASLEKTPAESQLGPAGYGLRQTESPWPSLYPGSSLANAKFGSRLVSANSILSGSCPPSRLTATTPSLFSDMSDEGSRGEHGWGQIETTAPFLYSTESFANSKSGELASAKSFVSGSPTPGHLTITMPSLRSVMVMSDEGSRLGLGKHGWKQIEPTGPFRSESFANAKFGGRLVSSNPLLSAARIPR